MRYDPDHDAPAGEERIRPKGKMRSLKGDGTRTRKAKRTTVAIKGKRARKGR